MLKNDEMKKILLKIKEIFKYYLAIYVLKMVAILFCGRINNTIEISFYKPAREESESQRNI